MRAAILHIEIDGLDRALVFVTEDAIR